MAIRLATQRWEYVLKEDRDSEDPTVFIIRELTSSQRAELTQLYGRVLLSQKTSPVAMSAEMDKTYRKVCDMGIEEVRNVLNADGEVMDIGPTEVLDLLRTGETIKELSEAVLDHNRISKDEEKK